MIESRVQEFYWRDYTGTLLQWGLDSRILFNKALSLLETSNDKSYFSLYDKLKDSTEYKALPKSHPPQQTIKLACETYKSYQELLKLWFNKKLKHKPQYPSTIKTEPQTVVFTNQTAQIKNDRIYFTKTFSIPIPQGFDYDRFQQIRIKHINKNTFKIGIIYNIEIPDEQIQSNNKLGIDLGSINLVSGADTLGNAFLITNKPTRGIIGRYIHNTKRKTNKKQQSFKRNKRVKDYLHKVSRKIIDYCKLNNIFEIIVGNNKEWKSHSKLSNKVNRYFVGTTHSKLISMIQYKAKETGIKVSITEESYTSKCDALASEELKSHSIYLGKRIKRGLFQSSVGKLINADINGAINIIRKIAGNFVISNGSNRTLWNEGCWLQPYVWSNLNIKEIY